MPIYEFECSACHDRFERLQKLSDPDPAACPACGKAQVRRRVSAPAFRLAGSGWYETDFKSRDEKKHNLASSDEAAKPSGGEAKPAPDVGSKGEAGASKPAEPKPTTAE
ncbi:MAG: zinc ribbon domain-containing protein [Xanthomonadales bacterium]|nr:zinc ribbon domain-containing protein [Xanthomonadales bacterium]